MAPGRTQGQSAATRGREAASPAKDVITDLRFHREIAQVRGTITDWIDDCNGEVQDYLRWQFEGPSKYFRPLTIFACYQAIRGLPIPPALIHSAAVLEMFHNVSLIVDDILDRSRTRRGKATLHCRYGKLPALMTAGYIIAQGYHLVHDDPHDIRLLSELLSRLGIGECLQWRWRRQPRGIADWRTLAGEDTGTMFEVCACLGTRSERLRRFGGLLGLLYHGCDDVGDVRGASALGGGGSEDIRDGILTLPVALAIREPAVAEMFLNPTPENQSALFAHVRAKLPQAEAYLDGIAEEARQEARRHTTNVRPLFKLIEHTRALSRK